MPSGKQPTTTDGSQVEIRQADEKASAAKPRISTLHRMLMTETLKQAREIAGAASQRWKELAASGNSDANELASAEALAVSAAISVRQLEQYLSGESCEWLVRRNDAPNAAPTPSTKQ